MPLEQPNVVARATVNASDVLELAGWTISNFPERWQQYAPFDDEDAADNLNDSYFGPADHAHRACAWGMVVCAARNLDAGPKVAAEALARLGDVIDKPLIGPWNDQPRQSAYGVAAALHRARRRASRGAA